MNLNSVLKTFLIVGFTSSLTMGLTGCGNNDGDSETDAAQSTPPTSSSSGTLASTPPASSSTAATSESTTTTTSALATATPPPAPTTSTQTGSALAAASPFPSGRGILWKPVSHGFNGRLVVLIPPSIAQAGTPIRILDRDGNTLDQANYHNANGENGGRHHFIFSRTGSAYPAPSILSIGGSNFVIPNPGARYE